MTMMNIYDFGRDDDDVESDILQYLYVDVSCVREDPESRTWSRSLESGHYLTIPPKKRRNGNDEYKKKKRRREFFNSSSFYRNVVLYGSSS